MRTNDGFGSVTTVQEEGTLKIECILVYEDGK